MIRRKKSLKEKTTFLSVNLDCPGYHPSGRFSSISPDGKYLFFTKFADNFNKEKIKPFSRKWDNEILRENQSIHTMMLVFLKKLFLNMVLENVIQLQPAFNP
jgi:hypothetical protein